jgi:hypothetical protein
MTRRVTLALMLLTGMACGRATQAGPPIPYDEEGACPFQCCTYREWTAAWDTDLHTERRDDAPVAFHVRINDTITALTGVVTTTKAGRATARSEVVVGSSRVPVAVDQPIYLLRNTSGGDWKIWVNGVTDQQYIAGQGYCSASNQSSAECALRVVEQPETVWWVKMRDALGREGWTRETAHFSGIDSCG